MTELLHSVTPVAPEILIPSLSPSDVRALEQHVVERSRVDSAVFTQYVFDYKNAAFHNEWHRFADTHQIGQMLAFRGSGKTEQMSIGRATWEIGRDPDIRIKLVTETDDLSKKILSKISETVLDSERFHRVFPHIEKSKRHAWTSKQLTVARTKKLKDPTLEAMGIFSARTGSRADLIFFDDVCCLRNAILHPKDREMVKEAFYSNWLKMRDDPEKFRWYMMGTPWHIHDIVSEIRANPAIPKCAEVKVGANFESPWPERLSAAYFMQEMEIARRRHFNRAYRLIALDDEESWVDVNAIKATRDFNLVAADLYYNQDLPKFTGVDLGHRTGQENSPTVIFTIAMLPSGQRAPCNIRVSHEASPLNTVRLIRSVHDECNTAIVMVENVGAQQYMVELAQTLGSGSVKIEGFFTGAQKFDPMTGVPSLLAEVDAGKWRTPLGTGGAHSESCLCHYCVWMGQLLDFPNGAIDMLMASWLAQQGLRKLKERANPGGGFSVWSLSG